MRTWKQQEINSKLLTEIESGERAFERRFETTANDADRYNLQLLERQVAEMKAEVQSLDDKSQDLESQISVMIE